MATPTTSFFTPGPGNVFIPEATRQMVEFSRNPDTFAFAQYCQVVPVTKITGLYPELSSKDPINVVDLNESLWPDGQERPKGAARPLRWRQYNCERHAYNFPLGNLTVDQASFGVVGANARGQGVRAMTSRTLDALTVLSTAGNWPAANTAATVDALLGTTSGSAWTVSSIAQNFIKRSFNTVKRAIAQQTGGAVRPGDLMCVVNPVLASQMGETGEIIAYVVNHEQSLASLQGKDRRLFDDYGLPPSLYGIDMRVEDGVRMSSRRAAGTEVGATLGYIQADNDAFFIARPGGQVANEGEATLATLVAFVHEDMIVESEQDAWNRLTRGSVVDNRDVVLAAPNSGFFVQDVTT